MQQTVNFPLMRGTSASRAPASVLFAAIRTCRATERWASTKAQAGIPEQLKKAFGFDPPREPGHNVVKAVEAMVSGRAKVLIGLGGNFIRAVPD